MITSGIMRTLKRQSLIWQEGVVDFQHYQTERTAMNDCGKQNGEGKFRGAGHRLDVQSFDSSYSTTNQVKPSGPISTGIWTE